MEYLEKTCLRVEQSRYDVYIITESHSYPSIELSKLWGVLAGGNKAKVLLDMENCAKLYYERGVKTNTLQRKQKWSCLTSIDPPDIALFHEDIISMWAFEPSKIQQNYSSNIKKLKSVILIMEFFVTTTTKPAHLD